MFRFTVRGIVQGVGFRPYIYRKASKLGLKGYVKNIGSGVEIVVDDREFMEGLFDLPPLAHISGYEMEEVPNPGFNGFSILDSTYSDGGTILPADIFTCDECLAELRDERDRRKDYYFITCTNCGPRFSMIFDHPYDRPNTSMREFSMCSDCEREYRNPMDRRYHAQTIACKNCGPRLKMIKEGRDVTAKTDYKTISFAAELILAGELVSIKGVGGFHICALSDEDTVRKVRSLLGRPNKPFALMVKDVEAADNFAHITESQKKQLMSPQRPIVVLKKKRECFGAVSELSSIGVMLPYTPLHHLLFDFIREPLVMTSANIPGEPVSIDESVGINFLTHDRMIVNRCDDSVVKEISGTPLFLRRSRGFAPLPIKMPIDCIDTISLGAELNNAVSATKGTQCFLSQYIGDTSKVETLDFLKGAVDSLRRLTRLVPELVACDLHPRYNSTTYARELADGFNIPCVPIQHHMAHVASVAAENDLSDYVGIAVDGLGYRDDGNIWGGEVFRVLGGTDIERVGGLLSVPQLGGDSAAKNPKKMLFGILSQILSDSELIALELFSGAESSLYLKQLSQGFNTPMSSSAGRVLDATCAFLGVCDTRTYDGRPAMMLESVATTPYELEPEFKEQEGRTVLDTTALFKFLLEMRGEDVGRLAATAQTYLARGLYDIAFSHTDGQPIVLSGGVAYNQMISSYMLERGVLINRKVPAGDGGICFGQAYLSNLMRQKGLI